MQDRKSTRLNSSHTEIYTLSLHDALPILPIASARRHVPFIAQILSVSTLRCIVLITGLARGHARSEEHTSELQSHRDLHSFPTRRSSDLADRIGPPPRALHRSNPFGIDAPMHRPDYRAGARAC